jgi:toxin CcdB
MNQLDVHRLNPVIGGRGESSEIIVFLQHRHARAIDTVIVAPVVLEGTLPSLQRARPSVILEGREHIAVVDRLAAVERHSIGQRVGSLENYRDELIRAVDVLLTGF